MDLLASTTQPQRVTRTRPSDTVLVHKPPRGRLDVVMPYLYGNRDWLKGICGRIRPEWNGQRQCWEVARAHFIRLVPALAARHGHCEVWIDHSKQTICTDTCRNATGWECDCSCLGRAHGGGLPLAGFIERGEFAIGTEYTRVAYEVRAAQ